MLFLVIKDSLTGFEHQYSYAGVVFKPFFCGLIRWWVTLVDCDLLHDAVQDGL